MEDIHTLKPKLRKFGKQLIAKCKKDGIEIRITQTFRSREEQNALYAQGRTALGTLVTQIKGGFSFHNYGVAFDVCPIINGKPAWERLELFKQVGAIGEKLGLEWGGEWGGFRDFPHFQYTAGYSISDFRGNKINWKKFA
jgi:peptidoglycan L-alanyl-D-glutamate endopeptidase CwlK